MDDNETILDYLYEIRSEEFDAIFAEEHRKQLEENDTIVKKEELTEMVNKLFKLDEQKMLKLMVVIDEYESAFTSELDFWCKKYYKLGFADAQKLKEECKMLGDKK